VLLVESTRPRSARVVPFAAGSLVATVFVALSLLWLWHASSPWDRPIHPLLPSVLAWVSFVLGARAGGVIAIIRIGGYALLGGATIVMVWVAGFGLLGQSKFEQSFRSLDVTARSILDLGATSGCPIEPPAADYGRFGTPDAICISVYGNGMHQRVQFGWGPRFLVYEGASRTEPKSRCVRHLQDRWWAEAEADPYCPGGFEFRGG
jgi:hypothetical protein